MQHLRLKAKTGSLCQFLPPIPPLLNVASVRILAAIMFKGRVKHYYDEDDRSSIWVVWAMCWAARHLLEPARPQGPLPGWEVSKGLHATCVYSPTSLPSQTPEKQDIFLSIKDLCLLLWRSRAGVHGLLGPTSRLKEIEKQMKQRNLLQSFKGYSYSDLLTISIYQ